MSIAQRFVAGEGDLHPADRDVAEQSLDDEALSEFTCDTTNLPWVVFRAAFRAEHLSALPARARALLAALARTVDAARPYAAIFARRELLTGRSMQSMRTFYRSLCDLEAAGLIHRPPQKRHGDAGLFGRAYLYLTPKAAGLLGLVSNEVDGKAAIKGFTFELAPREHDNTTRSGHPGTNANLPSATLADGGIYKDLSPTASQKRQPGKLPADLERLCSLGLRKFLIFKLMREARQNGKRLSDVVDVAWDHLRVAHAPIAYLRKLLSVPVDFTYQRLAREAAALEAQTAATNAEHVREAIIRSAGRTFFDMQGQRRFEVAPDASTLTVRDLREPQARVAVSGWQSDFVAGLEAGRLLPGTPELAMQFGEQLAQASRTRPSFTSQPQESSGPNTLARCAQRGETRQATSIVLDHLAQLKNVVAGLAGRGTRTLSG